MRYIKSFNESQNPIELNLQSEYDTIELVPISELLKFREFDRTATPTNGTDGGFSHSRETIDNLKRKIKEEGVTTPLIIAYSQPDKKVLLTEGNHRLAAAIELGMKYFPARVYRTTRNFEGYQKKRAMKVTGVEPNQHKYVPGDLRPSQVGIPGCKSLQNRKGNLFENISDISYKKPGYEILYYKWVTYDTSGSISNTQQFEEYEDVINFAIKLSNDSTTERLFIYTWVKTPGLDPQKVRVKWWASQKYLELGQFRIKNLLGYDSLKDYLFGLKDAYNDIILKAPNTFIMLADIKVRCPYLYDELLKIDPNIETGADMGDLGFK